MTARTARRRSVVLASVVLLGLPACGGGSSAEPTTSSGAGSALLRAATRAGAASDAVSFQQRTISAGRAEEVFARRGDDSLVATEYDDGGRNEVRRVDGTVYVRSDLRLTAGGPAPWIRIDAGVDADRWIDLLGDDLLAPTPGEVSGLLAAGVDRVTAVRRAGPGARTLVVRPVAVADGERPTSIRIRRTRPAFVGRVAGLFVDGERVARRTYAAVRWGDRAEAITVPAGTVAIDGVRDPQVLALPAAVRRAPAALPAGWGLRAAVGITPSQGDGTCQQALTLYAPAGRPLADGYLAVYLKAAGCPTPAGAGSAPFTAGANAGWIGQDAGSTVGGLTVDGVSVRFRTSLPERDLAPVLATWTPLPA